MKSFTAILVCFLVIHASFVSGQVNLGLHLTNNLKPAVEKVLNNYTEHYSAVRGDTLEVTESAIVFNSAVKPEASLQCTLTQFKNDKYDYSWEAVMMRTEDFDAAVKKYNTCCQQLKNISFRAGSEMVKMDGVIEAPEGTKNFYSTVFGTHTADPVLSRVKVEVLLESDDTEWSVKVLIYDQVHDDKEGSMN